MVGIIIERDGEHSQDQNGPDKLKAHDFENDIEDRLEREDDINGHDWYKWDKVEGEDDAALHDIATQ